MSSVVRKHLPPLTAVCSGTTRVPGRAWQPRLAVESWLLLPARGAGRQAPGPEGSGGSAWREDAGPESLPPPRAGAAGQGRSFLGSRM